MANKLSGPRYQPNYRKLILTDPLYQQAVKDQSANGIASDAALTGSLQSGAINEGGIPDLATAASQLGIHPDNPLYKALAGVYADPNIQSAARNNPFSTQANADYDHTKALGGILDNLGARGGYQQGAYGSAATAENRAYGAGNQANILSYLTGIQHAFDTHTQQQQTSANTLATAAQQATNRQIGLNPVIPGAGLTPHGAMQGLNMPKAPAQASAFQAPAFSAHGGTA